MQEIKSQIIEVKPPHANPQQQTTQEIVPLAPSEGSYPQSKFYCFFNYVDCQQLAQPRYKSLFTHWPSLLHKLERPEYVSIKKAPILLNATPEQVFTLLFPNSSTVKVNYFKFVHTLGSHFQIDLDALFRELDQDFDDWINYRDTGLLLESFCMQREQHKNCVRIIFETVKRNPSMPNTISFADIEEFLTKQGHFFAKQ